MLPYVNIHTHRPTGRGIELRTAGVHPWKADPRAVEALTARFTAGHGGAGVQAAGNGVAGAQVAGMQVVGNGVAGVQVAGIQAAGHGVAGMQVVGNGVAGVQVAGVQVAGVQAAGNRVAGNRVAGAQVAGMQAIEVQAIGETGLDFACTVPRDTQLAALRAQLALARRERLPVVLHCVRAFEPLMRELDACEPRAVIFHGFIGSPEQARQALARGYCLSFGERAFASPKTLRALHETPLGQLFLETDDADVAIEEIYARAAEELGIPVEVLQRATLENYERIFGRENG